MLGFVLLFVALFIVILVHEFGHLVAMRRVGMEVDTLAVGVRWGPHIKIESEFLRRYAGPKFTLVLSPLILVGYVRPSDPEHEEKLRDDEKALVYGGGVIANILLAVFILGIVTAVTVWKNSGSIIAPNLPLVGGMHTWAIIPMLFLFAFLLLYFARFVCKFIFPIIGVLVFALVVYVFMEISLNADMLARGGFIELATQTENAGQRGDFWMYVAYISVIVGLGNLLPLYPLDGGHLGMIHVRRFVPRFEPYYRRLGMVCVIFLLVFQFVPDLYRLSI